MQAYGPAQGWTCPLCRTVYAPEMPSCGCEARSAADVAGVLPIKVIVDPWLPPGVWWLGYPGRQGIFGSSDSVDETGIFPIKTHTAGTQLPETMLRIPKKE